MRRLGDGPDRLAKLSDLDDTQGEQLPSGLGVALRGDASPVFLNCLPRLV